MTVDSPSTPHRLRRGLLPLDPELHARFSTAEQYGFTFPEVSYPIDRSGGVTDFGMGGNGPDDKLTVNGGNPCGDCGPNAVPKNVDQTTAVVAAGAFETAMTSNQIVTLYFTYQAELAGIAWRPEGDDWTAPDGLDNGVDLGSWLLWLYQKGLIDGFLKLELSEMDAALQTFDAVVVGVSLNREADEQCENGKPWDIGPGDEPDPQEGHAIQRLANEGPTGLVKYATWGQQQPATQKWDKACPQQAFAVLTKEQADAAGFPFAALEADLKALGGTAA